jgi:hypothetical protein
VDRGSDTELVAIHERDKTICAVQRASPHIASAGEIVEARARSSHESLGGTVFVASHSHVIVEAAGKNAGPLNISGLQAFLISVVGLLIIVVGAGIVMSSRKGDMAKTANTSVIAIIGLVFVAMGAGTVAVVALGSSVLHLFLN